MKNPKHAFKQFQVIEDKFAAGRPAWEKVGAQFVPDVAPYENMKLRLLNAGHSVLAIIGALHGYRTIAECARDSDLTTFLRDYMDIEATPTLAKLAALDLDHYKVSIVATPPNEFIWWKKNAEF